VFCVCDVIASTFLVRREKNVPSPKLSERFWYLEKRFTCFRASSSSSFSVSSEFLFFEGVFVSFIFDCFSQNFKFKFLCFACVSTLHSLNSHSLTQQHQHLLTSPFCRQPHTIPPSSSIFSVVDRPSKNNTFSIHITHIAQIFDEKKRKFNK